MQTYLFYDIETTGLNKSFDQVLHFAAIRTDLNLVEIERYDIKVKLNPDVIPSPYALITHKMGIKEIQHGVSEFDAIKHIHQLFNTAGTISLGYNTLGFDDEFLRFSFYRNLLKPYTHQYANQCSRMDIYPMAVMFFLFKNNILSWPMDENKLSLKLEKINAANQFISGRSHHAMVDVEVTLELARRFRAEQDMWEYLLGYFKKETDNTRMQQAQPEMALLVRGKLGYQANYQCPVLFLGKHRHYGNQTIWLRMDTEELTQITAETIAEKSWGISKKPGEPPFILPYKERFLQHMAPERIELVEKNKQWLLENPETLKNITDYYLNYKYPVLPETDIDASLYINGFWSSEEETFCQRFHLIKPEARAKLVKETDNAKLKTLGLRILGRQNAEMLSLSEAEAFADYLRRVNKPHEDEVLIDFQGRRRMTPQKALEEIAAIRVEKTLDEEDLQLLNEYENYLQNRV